MRFIYDYFRRRRHKPYVRPWALTAPVLVLLVCLPLLRPLRHAGQPSHDEELRLATISALVEHANNQDSNDLRFSSRLAINESGFRNRTITVEKRIYSDQPPMMAVLLSGPCWVLEHFGYKLSEYAVLVPYLLTLLGVTLPAACAAGLIYRMGRIFELPRPLRAALGAIVVFASGLISYAVVLNQYVPASVLVIASAAALVHLNSSKTPARGGAWLILAGFCAALAATIDPPAVVFLVLLALVIPFMRLRPSLRVGGVLLYCIGAILPIVVHGIFVYPLTGDLLPGSMHRNLATGAVAQSHQVRAEYGDLLDSQAGTDDDLSDPAFDEEQSSIMLKLWHGTERVISELFGAHGILSHFPVVLLGVLGMLAVMHRNWLAATKTLAAITAGAAIIVMIVYAILVHSGSPSGFANRRFILFLPLLLFWSGAWLRRRHHPAMWSVAGVLLVFSVIVGLIGATDPLPRDGYTRYTVTAALKNIFSPSQAALAGR